MSKKLNFFEDITTLTSRSFDYLKRQSVDYNSLVQLCTALGWNLDSIGGEGGSTFKQLLLASSSVVESIEFTEIKSFQDLLLVKDKVKSIQHDWVSIKNQIEELELNIPEPELLKDLVVRLLEASLLRHFMMSYPVSYSVLKYLRAVGPRIQPSLYNSNGEILVSNDLVDHFLGFSHLSSISDFLSEEYWINRMISTSDTQIAGDKIFKGLSRIFQSTDLEYQVRRNRYSINGLQDSLEGYAQLILFLGSSHNFDPGNDIKIVLELLGEEDGGPAIGVSIQGDLNQIFEIGSWSFRLNSNLEGGTIKISESDATIEGNSINNFFLGFSLVRSEPLQIIFGSNNGTRFEISDYGIHLTTRIKDGLLGWRLVSNVESALIIKGNSGDSFITKIVGTEGLKIDLNLEIGYDSVNGVFFGAQVSTGLSRTYQINKTLFDFLTIHNVKAGLELNNSNFNTAFTTDISVRFGNSVRFKVDGIGLLAGVDFESETKNLGIGEFDLTFKRPKGIGVSLDFGPDFKGSGYLYINPPKYYGYLSLSIKSFQLDMLGVLVTELPEDPDGYSFLALITMQFPSPIPLAFGFYLQGAGGIVGLHRSLNPETFRDGVRTGALDQLFFPENIIENVDTIIGQMESYFPVYQGRHSFGLLFDLSYGESDMVKIELGLLLTVPQPIIIAIAGTLKIRSPKIEDPKLTINCAFLGYYDSGKQLISFDARIYDSSIVGLTLEGDISARMGWGNNKMFVISVGGFHPQFVPDTTWNMGSMNRMAVRLRDTESLKIYVESYFAVTSNTFQFGSRGMLKYKGGGFTAEAYNGFDALFYFNPFRFTVDISASAQVSWKGFDIAAVTINGRISGPGIWNARGSASFEVACFNPSFSFDISWGNNSDQGLPAINVQALLEEELQKNSSWKGSGAQDRSVTYHQFETTSSEDSVLVLAPNEALTVNQVVVPFEVTIQKFGENPVTGPTIFNISSLKIGSTTFSNSQLIASEDYFAPNQFKALNNQQRLQSASYEKLKSGATTNSSAYGISIPLHNTAKEISYEQFYKGTAEQMPQEINQLVPSGGVSRMSLARGGALGRCKEFRNVSRKSKMKNKVRVSDTEYSIVHKDTLIKYDSDIMVSSKTQATEILSNSTNIETMSLSNLRVAPKFEHRQSIFVENENLLYEK